MRALWVALVCLLVGFSLVVAAVTRLDDGTPQRVTTGAEP